MHTNVINQQQQFCYTKHRIQGTTLQRQHLLLLRQDTELEQKGKTKEDRSYRRTKLNA
jgi:hypothetical protein